MPSTYRSPAAAAVGLVLCLLPFSASAQNVPVPKFDMGKPPEKETDWNVQAKGSLLVTSGNSQSRNTAFGFNGSRQSGANKTTVEAQLAYGRSNVLVPVRDPVNPMLIVGLERQAETTTNQWLARAREDWFFTDNNSAYLLGQLASDRIAGKRLFGGGQVGYSRQLLKNERHTAVAELGYDFSYESYLEQPGKTLDPVQIHSARVFLGEQLKLSDDTGITGGVEALFNLNEENALDASGPDPDPAPAGQVAAFKDIRLVGKLGLTTTIWKDLSFAFGFTVKYDQNPAPRPLPGSAKGGMFVGTFFSDEVDTLTEASLIFTFL